MTNRRCSIDIDSDIDIYSVTRLEGYLIVKMRANISTLTTKPDGVNPPQVSHSVLSISAILAPDKPTVVYSGSDTMTGRKLEIVVTAKLIEVK